METKAVKISAENYRKICVYAGELQKELGVPVSIDRTISFLFDKTRLSDLAGSWKMSDREAREMMENLKRGWGKWKIKSV